jgi:enoyl-CoA hydratase
VAQEIVASSPFGIRMTKEVMRSQLEVASLAAGLVLENNTEVMSTFTADQRGAVVAFQQRRNAEFSDH